MIAQQYETQKVLSASPMELILMLYDGALRSLSQALAAFDLADDIERMNGIHEQLLRAQDFITELACSLDIERGGELAEQLNRLYEFMLHHLAVANSEKQRKPVEDVKSMLTELRNSWSQAMERVPREEQPEPVPVDRTGSFRISG
ncbi:MAG: flagellar export chaperone FliS [Lentisphaerae bacterium]|nr:flagellar export chaperone FliS [Lentisphaerota bacterium]